MNRWNRIVVVILIVLVPTLLAGSVSYTQKGKGKKTVTIDILGDGNYRFDVNLGGGQIARYKLRPFEEMYDGKWDTLEPLNDLAEDIKDAIHDS